MTQQLQAVVTGASSGIGAASARALAKAGYHVWCAARRVDRITELATEIGGTAIGCDITDPDQVAKLVSAVGGQLDLLVNNAGGAFGLEPVESADLAAWRAMYETNVLGAVSITKALLPALISSKGTVVFVTSTAAEAPYEGGAGYNAAKAGERMVAGAMRLELFDQPVRICEISPGMVQTDEFALTRFAGDTEKAASIYAGVAEPLVAEDVADAICWMATRPAHVNIDRITIRPCAQAAQHKVDRRS